MKEVILCFEIFQPFAQYRNPFTFYYAQTYPLPPKTTIIGMLQNATGRFYDEKFWDLKISVHGGFESIFWNYQQLIKGEIKIDKNFKLINQGRPLYNEGLKSQRTPVYQQELFNGHLYIFIKGKENKEIELLHTIEQALTKPKKILYLGRSEDVIFIKKVKFVEEKEINPGDAKRSVWITYPTYVKKQGFPIKNQKYPVYSIPIYNSFKNNGKPIRNKAEITKKTTREVEFETVIYTSFDSPIKLNEKVHFDEINIDNKKFRIFSEQGWL